MSPVVLYRLHQALIIWLLSEQWVAFVSSKLKKKNKEEIYINKILNKVKMIISSKVLTFTS